MFPKLIHWFHFFLERGKEKIKFKILKPANTNTASKTDL